MLFIYIGETMRELKTRLKQHKSDLHRTNKKSEIAEHSFKSGHSIDWDNPKIEQFERNYHKRKLLESLTIEKMKLDNKELMNKQQKNQSVLPNQYMPVLKSRFK